MARQVGHKIVVAATQLAISVMAIATAAHAASLVTVSDTRVFPESISVTSDGTLLIAGSEKGTIYKAAPGTTTAQPWISREQAGFEGFLLGIYADEPHGVFYVCSDVVGPPSKAAFTAFDLKTGAKRRPTGFRMAVFATTSLPPPMVPSMRPTPSLAASSGCSPEQARRTFGRATRDW
jgi:hypothetical protein